MNSVFNESSLSLITLSDDVISSASDDFLTSDDDSYNENIPKEIEDKIDRVSCLVSDCSTTGLSIFELFHFTNPVLMCLPVLSSIPYFFKNFYDIFFSATISKESLPIRVGKIIAGIIFIILTLSILVVPEIAIPFIAVTQSVATVFRESYILTLQCYEYFFSTGKALKAEVAHAKDKYIASNGVANYSHKARLLNVITTKSNELIIKRVEIAQQVHTLAKCVVTVIGAALFIPFPLAGGLIICSVAAYCILDVCDINPLKLIANKIFGKYFTPHDESYYQNELEENISLRSNLVHTPDPVKPIFSHSYSQAAFLLKSSGSELNEKTPLLEKSTQTPTVSKNFIPKAKVSNLTFFTNEVADKIDNFSRNRSLSV